MITARRHVAALLVIAVPAHVFWACSSSQPYGLPGLGADGGLPAGDAGAHVSGRAGSDGGSADGGNDGYALQCKEQCGDSNAGSYCFPVTPCDDVLCVCDQDTWQCGACVTQDGGCPSAQPADGTPCPVANAGLVCLYPDPDAGLYVSAGVSMCRYSPTSDQMFWSNWVSVGESVPVAGAARPPPVNEATDGSVGFGYYGVFAGWDLDCYNFGGTAFGLDLPQVTTYCYLSPIVPMVVTAGGACDGVPRGYPTNVYVSENVYASCICEGTTNPVWTCTPNLCPADPPDAGWDCPPQPLMACIYANQEVCTCGVGWWCAAP